MEVSRGCVYLYEFTNYDRFTADIELLMDINHEFDFTLLSRLPTPVSYTHLTLPTKA